MTHDTHIQDEKHRSELQKIKADYLALPWYKKFWLHLCAWSLARGLAKLNPDQMSDSAFRHFMGLFVNTWFYQFAFGVLQSFQETQIYQFFTTSPQLNKLNYTVRNHAFSFLPPDGQSNLEVTLRFFDKEDRKDRIGQALLRHTIRGNQDTVVAILKRYPELLLYRGDVFDLSGRFFKKVTAFELALWALDVHFMVPAMLSCLHDNEWGKDYRASAPELSKQYQQVTEINGRGVEYSIGCLLHHEPFDALLGFESCERANMRYLYQIAKGGYNACIQFKDAIFYYDNQSAQKSLIEITDSIAVTVLKKMIHQNGVKHACNGKITYQEEELRRIEQCIPTARHLFKERHFDFTPLIHALETTGHLFVAPPRSNQIGHDEYFRTAVGTLQRLAPAHVIQHCLAPRLICDTSDSLKRSFEVFVSKYNDEWYGKALGNCFRYFYNGSWEELGVDFAILGTYAQSRVPFNSSVAAQLALIKDLCQTRTSELKALESQLIPHTPHDVLNNSRA